MWRATNSGKVSASASSMIRDVRSERRVASPTIASASESATEMVNVAPRGTCTSIADGYLQVDCRSVAFGGSFW